MRITIDISSYVDTIDVFVNGTKININKLSLFSKAKFEYDVEAGVHEIYVVKGSKISESNWGKWVVFDWISCLLGVPDWTLKEKAQDINKSYIVLKVKVDHDVRIKLNLTESGFRLIEKSKDVLDVVNQTKTSKIAQKRVRNAYVIPALILAAIIEICMLTVCVFSIMNSQYTVFAVVLALSLFWGALICNMVLRGKK